MTQFCDFFASVGYCPEPAVTSYGAILISARDIPLMHYSEVARKWFGPARET